MFRLLLYVLFGYVIWRIVQIIVHVIGRSSKWDRENAQPPPAPKKSPPQTGFTDVKDARFEDLPPSAPKNDKTAPSS